MARPYYKGADGSLSPLKNANFKSTPTGGVSQEYVDSQDASTLESAKAYADSKVVTIEIEDRGGQNFWTRPVSTAQEIIDMVNAGKEVRLSFYDTITNTGDQLYPYENTRTSVPYFRRNVITASKISRISWGVQYNGSIVAEEIPYDPGADPLLANWNLETNHPIGSWWFSDDPTSPASLFGGTWERLSGHRGLIAADDGDGAYGVGKTSGAETHMLTLDELPSHVHVAATGEVVPDGTKNAEQFPPYSLAGKNTGEKPHWYYNGATKPSGGGKAHSIMNPAYATYIWRRTA